MKNDTDTIEINLAKTHASSEKYFALFDKYIANTYNENSTVLLYDICNEGCIELIVNKNPMATYVVYDCQEMKVVLPVLIPGVKFIFINNKYDNVDLDKQFEYNLSGMKFDCIIMNPPYQRNLHLKVLEKAIEQLKDDDSVCVNLSPILWIEDPHAHTKEKSNLSKFNNSICKHTESIDIIDTKQANEVFNIGLFSNLGIYKCKQTCSNSINKNTFWQRNFADWEIKLFNKVYDMPKHLSDVCDKNKRSGIRVLLTDIAGNRGTLPIYKDISYTINGKKDGLDWTKCKNNGGYEKPEGSNIPLSIEFDSENAAQNFYDSYKTTFMKWLCKRFLFDQHIQFRFLPFMTDYTEPWTDERFYKFFGITSNEQALIENAVAMNN